MMKLMTVVAAALSLFALSSLSPALSEAGDCQKKAAAAEKTEKEAACGCTSCDGSCGDEVQGKAYDPREHGGEEAQEVNEGDEDKVIGGSVSEGTGGNGESQGY